MVAGTLSDMRRFFPWWGTNLPAAFGGSAGRFFQDGALAALAPLFLGGRGRSSPGGPRGGGGRLIFTLVFLGAGGGGGGRGLLVVGALRLGGGGRTIDVDAI